MLLNEEQLKKQNFLKTVKILLQDIIIQDKFRNAYNLSKQLERSIAAIKDFKEKRYELYREYRKIIIQLKWIGLPIMTESMIIDIFQHHFADMFKVPEYDIWPKLKIVLLGITIFDDRDKFKERLRKALMDNQQEITSRKIILDNQEKSPTISNWIKDYNKILGADAVDKIASIQYLTNGKNVKNLSGQEKNKIKILFDLYEKLKLSSHTLEGLEEDIPVDEDNMKGIIKGGVFEPYEEAVKTRTVIGSPATPEEKKIEELRYMANQYLPNSLERKAIEEEINKIKNKKQLL